jgi:formylmethanofuran dehydrogenase subunit E
MAEKLEGTCNSPEYILERTIEDHPCEFEEVTDWKDVLLEVSCERCSECGYWAIQDCDEDSNGNPVCSSCWEDEEDD